MSNKCFIRVSLQLHYFFNDYRQQSRVVINEDEIKNIFDLKNYIKKTFDIEDDFYLQCDRYFLPDNQNIQVLKNDDNICVLPHRDGDQKCSQQSQIHKKEKNKRKRKISKSEEEYANENYFEASEGVKKKSKKKKSIALNYDIVIQNIDQNNSTQLTEKVTKTHPEKTIEKNKSKRQISENSSECESTINKNLETSQNNKRKSKKEIITVLNEEIVTDNIELPKEISKVYKKNDTIDFDSLRKLKTKRDSQVIENNNADDRYTVKSKKKSLENSEKGHTLENNCISLPKNSQIFDNTANLSLSKTKIGSWDNTTVLPTTTRISKTPKNSTLQDQSVQNDPNFSKTQIENWDDPSFVTPKHAQKVPKDQTIEPNLEGTNTSTPNMSKTKIGTWEEISKIQSPNFEREPNEVTQVLFNEKSNLSLSNTKMGCWDNSSVQNGLEKSKNLHENPNWSQPKIGNWDNSSQNSTLKNNLSLTKMGSWNNTSLATPFSKNNSRASTNLSPSINSQILENSSTSKANLSVMMMGSWDNTVNSRFSENILLTLTDSKIVEISSRSNESTLKNCSTNTVINNFENADQSSGSQNYVNTRRRKAELKQNSGSKDSLMAEESKMVEISITPASENNHQETQNKEQIQNAELESSLNDSSFLDNSSIIPSSQRNTTFKLLKTMNSVSSTLKRLSSENDQNLQQSYSSNLMTNQNDNVTKRKRVRTRKHKRKSNSDESFTAEKTQNNLKFEPPKTVAAPKIHKRFDSDGENADDSDDRNDSLDLDSINSSALSHSTPYCVNTKRRPEMSTIHEELSPGMLKTKYLEIENVLNEPPELGSKIIFKTLKLTEEYTPVESDYIFAEVLTVGFEEKSTVPVVEMKVLAGHKELKVPKGRFSMLDENEEDESEADTSLANFKWNDLIEPKLIENN